MSILWNFNHFTKSTTFEKMRSHGRIIASVYDLCAVIIAWTFTYWILSNTIPGPHKITEWQFILGKLIWILPLQFLLFRLYGLYRGFWRFASIQDLQKILSVSALGGFIIWVILYVNTSQILFPETYSIELILLPHSIIAFFYSVFLAALLSIGRFLIRLIKDYKHLYGDHQRVIIIGAGNAGEGLVRDLLRDSYHRYKPVAFVDDNLLKLGREIHGVRVVGTIAELPSLIIKYAIDLALIAIPSASSASMRSVVDICEQAHVRYYTLPGIKDLANGRVSINVLRSVSLEDLLGRYPVTCQWEFIKAHLKNKTILITGGGGSIGSELCRQIATLGENIRLVIVDNSEYNLYNIDMELRQRFPSHRFYPVLLSVTDRMGIQAILKEHQPQLIFHAAAYKHVPMLEHQPRVAMYNNIIGTCVLAEEAVHANVETFILISSDKAVNPTNIMGATKRAAEYFCHNLNDAMQKTLFITVRFGNVLDSAGSVIPLFRKQIEMGGPVTVTHPDITRFFMTIPEASQLILQAAFLGAGGEIFVLDMGDPIKIRYLAEQMIKLADKIVGQDIKIVYTGLRPGEKLYEECFYSNETLQPTPHTKILRAQSQRRDFKEIKHICDQISKSCQASDTANDNLILLLKKLVPEYQSVEEINA
ncbi:MAG: hypothetical protein ACD_45C00684G0007 [uncultured bacterium]|nr:MAG: hypothetical protein ACD_45C00684G0007 [uncultured bacterium]